MKVKITVLEVGDSPSLSLSPGGSHSPKVGDEYTCEGRSISMWANDSALPDSADGTTTGD